VPTAPSPDISEDAYTALEAAISETLRGRNFLKEHARRARRAETQILLSALQRIEARIGRMQVGAETMPTPADSAASSEAETGREEATREMQAAPAGPKDEPDPWAHLKMMSEEERAALFT
jgi:hypothetical protein